MADREAASAGGVANAAIAAERAVRAAAREGNQLLAGSIASIRVTDPAVAAALRLLLRASGVRLGGGAADKGAHFVFVDSVSDAPETGVDGPRAPDSGRLPQVFADPSGRSRSPRGAGAESRISWATALMPATAELARSLRAAAGSKRVRLGVSLVLEPKTAAFALTLAEAGCEVAVFGAVSETDPEVAAALAGVGSVVVFAPTKPVPADTIPAVDAAHAAAILDWAPELLIDDGSHLLRLAHTERGVALSALRGAAEETTSGVRPLIEMVAEGELRVPVIAVNDARTKTGFDNRIGTGQSCVTAILDLLDPPASGSGCEAPNTARRHAVGETWAVIGYGPVGEGVARFAAAFGAEVIVIEHDPVRALAAQLDGHAAVSMARALELADVVVSATGVWHTLAEEHFAAMRPGVAVAVAGGIDDELALDELRASGWTESQLGNGTAEWRAPGAAAGPLVLANGGGVNYTAGEGNPIEVMDLSFATQLAALIRLLGSELPPGVHAVSRADEEAVARASLRARGANAEPQRDAGRPGGAAQHWRTHRYRSGALDSTE